MRRLRKLRDGLDVLQVYNLKFKKQNRYSMLMLSCLFVLTYETCENQSQCRPALEPPLFVLLLGWGRPLAPPPVVAFFITCSCSQLSYWAFDLIY